MRILVISAWAPWRSTDGASLVLAHQLPLLAPRHEVTVLTPLLPGEPDPWAGSVAESTFSARAFAFEGSRAVDAARRRLRSAKTGEPAHVYWVERDALIAAAREEVRRAVPDVLHLHGWGTAQLQRLAPAVPSVHVPVDAWGLGFDNRLMPAWRRLVERGERRRIEAHERKHYAKCSAVVVVSDRDRDYLAEHAPGARVHVIPNGVDAGAEPAPIPSDPVLGFHANFETVANVGAARGLLDVVFPAVKRRRSDARMLIFGRAAERVTRRNLAGGVEIVSDVPNVRDYLDHVAVYVAPLTSGTGIKNKVLEAMAAGRPVVTTPLGTGGIGAGGGVFETATVDGMVDTVVGLLDDRRRLEEAGRSARERAVSEFGWERSAHAIETLWSESVEAKLLRDGP